jgi:hypothetical protein
VLQRALVISAAVGIPTIAAGNIAHSTGLKFLGVSAMVASTLALAITTTALARTVRDRAARLMLLVSAAAITAGMVLAGAYGVGELTGRAWIGIPPMVAIHGLLNALGFTLFGLIGHLRAASGGGSWVLAPSTHSAKMTEEDGDSTNSALGAAEVGTREM